MRLFLLTEAAIVNIWVRLLNTLKRDILNAAKNAAAAAEAEDINVEHAQLLLFLFHTLPLMQKKSLLLQLAQVNKTAVYAPSWPTKKLVTDHPTDTPSYKVVCVNFCS